MYRAHDRDASWRQRVGLQTFTLGQLTSTQLCSRFGAIAGAGVELVEFLYDWIDQSATELRAALTANGLRCPSIKVPPVSWTSASPSLENGIGRVIEDAHLLGVEFVIAMMFSPPGGTWPAPAADETPLESIERVGRGLSTSDWQRNAVQLNRWATLLRKEGLGLAFHNTNFEFAQREGTSGFEILLHETDPDLVSFELDVGYALSGGVDPVELLRRHQGRFRLLHLKDVVRDAQPNHRCFQAGWTELGSGAGNWPAILAEAEAQGTIYYYIEQEPPFRGEPLESVRASLAFLDQLATKQLPKSEARRNTHA